MTEKWITVSIIIGCIFLVFLIYFSIDIHLFRRRKRLARERKNDTARRSQQILNGAAQYNAKVTVTKASAEKDYREINNTERKKYLAQRAITRFLSKLEEKSRAEALEFQESLAEKTLSERSSDFHLKTSDADGSHGNRYIERNGATHNASHCVYELAGSSKEKSIHRDLYDNDFLEYSREKRFSNVSKTRNENQEVSKYKKRSHLGARYDKKMSQINASQAKKNSNVDAHQRKKMSRLGALEPLENMTSVSLQ